MTAYICDITSEQAAQVACQPTNLCLLLLSGVPYFIYFGYGNHLISNVTTSLHKHSNRIANSNMSNMNFYATDVKGIFDSYFFDKVI